MSFDFMKRKTKAEKAEESMKDMTEAEKEHALAYRDRAKQERKRFVKATDTEFWLCLCFRSRKELDRWHEAFGFGEMHGFARYEDVKGSMGVGPGKIGGMSFGSGPSFGAGLSFGGGLSFGRDRYDPLADVKYEDDLERDCLAELTALHAAFVRAEAPKRLSDVTDSDIWTVLVFEDRGAKDAFISQVGATRDQQDKYVDAAKLAAHLGVKI